MPRKVTGQPDDSDPTKAELQILGVLWEHGPSTVRFVHETLIGQKREVQYTSTLKLMQLMAEKGMLKRDESSMKHIYRPAEKEESTKGQLVDRFINSFFSGSPGKLMMHLLGKKKPSKKELQEIKDLLEQLEKQNRK
ncbi:MAG: BlaI/MecI/CopY family transcriptional regulator [Chitinophagaceae bacterium]